MRKSIFGKKIKNSYMRKMKVIITTDSEILNERLQKILGGIQNLDAAGKGKDMDEALALVKSIQPDAMIISFNRITTQVFEKMKEIKKAKPDLIVIVLSSYPFVQYKIQWKEAGANFVFDQAMQFGKMVDVLCDLLYKQKLETLIVKKSLGESNSHYLNT